MITFFCNYSNSFAIFFLSNKTLIAFLLIRMSTLLHSNCSESFSPVVAFIGCSSTCWPKCTAAVTNFGLTLLCL